MKTKKESINMWWRKRKSRIINKGQELEYDEIYSKRSFEYDAMELKITQLQSVIDRQQAIIDSFSSVKREEAEYEKLNSLMDQYTKRAMAMCEIIVSDYQRSSQAYLNAKNDLEDAREKLTKYVLSLPADAKDFGDDT